MNRNKLKTYAPEARRDFIEAVTSRAAQYGLIADKIEPMSVEGDVAMIAGKPYSKAVGEKRKKLEARINRDGFEQTMEALAYTWFNRLVAIRYMELHEYLDHGYRVLSHPEGHNLPEIIEHAEHVDLPKLDKQKVVELKLDGTKEEELYRILLIGQCNALSKAMPFLFESIDDETELLLPDHLLHSDSLIRNLVNEIPEEDWQEVEIIGWLYQFYISEKKDEVIGKVVKSEDIPAATQLFTPNWIVKYLVQNSLGRQWMATYPDSSLKAQMEYFIEPAEQTLEVQAKLAEITPDSLNPEELTLCDPACGSGHILVEAYDLLKGVYQERGYRAKDVPRLILENNLYGLEIDDRAAQLAAFALMMKARADDRNIFERNVQPQVLSIQESKGLDAKEITESVNAPLERGNGLEGAVPQTVVAQLIALFEFGKTFGSLIRVPQGIVERLHDIAKRVEDVVRNGGMHERIDVMPLKPLLQQAQLLADHYATVVTNPPYMGSKSFTRQTKDYVNDNYKLAPADLYSCFIQRNLEFGAQDAVIAMITLPGWMFLGSFEGMRNHLLRVTTILSFVHNGRGVWGSDFGSCCFVLGKSHLPQFRGAYRKLFVNQASVASNRELEQRFFENTPFFVSADDLRRLPGCPIAYWASNRVRDAFENGLPLARIAEPRVGLQTGENDRFLRRWYEPEFNDIGFSCGSLEEAAQSGNKWFPYNKGGDYRKWYGNQEWVVNWRDDGAEIRSFGTENGGRPRSRAQNTHSYFRKCLSWSKVTIGGFSVREFDTGFVFDVAGCSLFPFDEHAHHLLAGILNSCLTPSILGTLAQTVNYEVGQVAKIPIVSEWADYVDDVSRIVQQCIDLAASDWNSQETSWFFERSPLIRAAPGESSLSEAHSSWLQLCKANIARMQELEAENNRQLLLAYGLDGEVAPEVPEDKITLYRPDREEDIKRLVSYTIGCMMGRYSLDKPGLIYAHSGNEGFDPAKYDTFPADEDGIVPLTDFHWFEDDAASRFEKFVATAWPKKQLEENLEFVGESLGQKRGESSRDTIRRYLATAFYKHHLSLYKKRPIYWLFSSGKQRGFQALVYLHRYNKGTLARMRTEYVIPLLGKMTARIDLLTDDIAAATSSQLRKRLEKDKATVVKQLAEVQVYDEKLRHYADQRISIDLDDGVKVNYGKFGTLLAEVKGVTGKKAEDVM